MGVLANFHHERFCQALHKRVWSGEKLSDARTGAYRDTVYRGNDPHAPSIADNARRLVQRKDIKARMAELAANAARMAELDAGWAMLQLKLMADDVGSFNLADYLAPPADGQTHRHFDIASCTPEQLGRLQELSIEGAGADLKIKLKGPDKYAQRTSIIALMARIAGWEAPKKIAPTTPAGNMLTLADLVGESYMLKQRQGAHQLPAPAEAPKEEAA